MRHFLHQIGLGLALLAPWASQAQNGGLSLSTNALNLGTLTELQRDSQAVVVTNTATYPVRVTGIRFFRIWGTQAFSCRDTNFTLAAGANKTIFIRFAPDQNVAYNSEALILNDSRRGSPRLDLRGIGRFSRTYYNGTEDLEDNALVRQLKTIISANYRQMGYNSARDAMFMTIDNQRTNGQGATTNTLECVYTGRLATGYTSRSDAQRGDNFNTEHTMPQSTFNSNDPMVSDLHHLFPTDNPVNGVRGNNDFANIPNSSVRTWHKGSVNQSTIPPDPQNWSKSTSSSFEPRDVHKGRAARALLYFATRHQDYGGTIQRQENTLRGWHWAFPPNAVDVRRNDDIALSANQRNRNPYVDYPQFLRRIASVTNASATQAAVTAVSVSETAINFGQIPDNQATTFTVLVANTGNRVANLTNIATSNPAFTVSPSSATIAVGEAAVLTVSTTLPSGVTQTGNLTFSLNSTGFTLPISANTLVGISRAWDYSFTAPQVFPNPAQEAVWVATHSLEGQTLTYSWVDAKGAIVSQGSLSQAQAQERLETPQAAGLYLLRLQAGTWQQTFRIGKE